MRSKLELLKTADQIIGKNKTILKLIDRMNSLETRTDRLEVSRNEFQKQLRKYGIMQEQMLVNLNFLVEGMATLLKTRDWEKTQIESIQPLDGKVGLIANALKAHVSDKSMHLKN